MNKPQVYENCYLVRDPSLKTTPTGKLIAEATVMYYTPMKTDQSGSNANFVDVVVWEQRAEQFVKLRKGQKINITGHLFQSRWKDPEGKTRSNFKVNVSSWQELAQAPKEAEASASGDASATDDDIPF